MQKAVRLLQLGKIRIGRIACRVREHAEVARSFRCLGYGHGSWGCGKPDRKNACWRCGTTGHLARSLQNWAHRSNITMKLLISIISYETTDTYLFQLRIRQFHFMCIVYRKQKLRVPLVQVQQKSLMSSLCFVI